jgi:phenylalanyl-tRNA synthetase beta chain
MSNAALTAEDLLICDGDARAPQAIAGIMGGAAAEVSDATTEILLESAYFTAAGIAKTAKRLGLRSEASARFERGIDPNGAGTGAARAMELLSDVASARPVDGAIDVYPQPIERPRIAVRTERVNQLLGTALTDGEVVDYLTPLGIELADGVATAPTFRPDLEREIDLIEEVARRVGLEHIERTIPASPEKIGGLTPRQRDRRPSTDVSSAPVTTSATRCRCSRPPTSHARRRRRAAIEVENPLRAEESLLRPRCCRIAARRRYNAAHGEPDVALFETGTVFAPPEGEPRCRPNGFTSPSRVARRPPGAARTRPRRRRLRRDRGADGAARRASHRELAARARGHRRTATGSSGTPRGG